MTIGNAEKKGSKGRWWKVVSAVLSLFVVLAFLHGSPATAACGCRCYPGICPGDDLVDMNFMQKFYIDLVKFLTNIAQKIGNLTGLNTLFNALSKLFKESFDDNGYWKKMADAAETVAEQINMHSREKQTDAKLSAMQTAALGAENARAIGENPPNNGSDQFLCNMLKVRMAIPVMQQYADMVADIIEQGIDAIGRGPTDLADSTQRSSDALIFKCREKLGSTYDQFPTACLAPHEVPGVSQADFDANAEILGRGRVYTLPPVENPTISQGGKAIKATVLVPNTDDETQVRFAKAYQYCYTLAGTRPTPGFGAQKFTADSMIKEAQFVSCRTAQREFNYRCAAMIGRLTRPDCSQDYNVAFCDVGREACSAAHAANIKLSSEFDDCTNGMSLSQFEEISVRLCGSSRSLQHTGTQGGQDSARSQMLTACAFFREMWEEQNREEEEGLRRAAIGLAQNRECFQGTGK